MNELEKAKSLALMAVRQADLVVRMYSQEQYWNQGEDLGLIPEKFARLWRYYRDAFQAVGPVVSRLFEGKRDDSIVQFRGMYDSLAHRIAVEYAHRVYFEFHDELFATDDEDVPSSGFYIEDLPSTDVIEAGLRNGDYDLQFQNRWRHIQRALERLLGGEPIEALNERIRLETIRAETIADKADNWKRNGVQYPKNQDVADLCKELALRLPNGEKKASIARDYCKGTDINPMSLLRQADRYRHLWE